MYEGNQVYWENEAELKAKVAAVKENLRNSPTLMRDAVLIVEKQVKENASGRPGPNVGTGRLRASIKGEVLTPNLGRVGTALQPHYAPDVEYGHSQTPGRFVAAIGKRLVKDSCPAYPFFQPAVEQVKPQLEGVVMVNFGKTLENIWRA